MQRAAPALKEALLKVIKENRERTPRWMSSSIPEERWDSDLARYSSADYYVTNLVSPVLFQEALQHVPAGTVVIEIAPHCLLQAILKHSLSADCLFVGLMKRNHADNTEYLLSNLGKVYMAGVDFNPLDLYPAVKMPVSRGTAMLSSLIKWDHEQLWDVPKGDQFIIDLGGSGSSISFEIDASAESKDSYLVGHKIDGRVLYPATGYLVLVWQTFAKINRRSYQQFPVAFEDVHIHKATIMPKTETVKLDVSITPGTGMFELCEGEALVVSGRVFQPSEPIINLRVCDPADKPQDLIRFTSSDIYKQLRLRGYDYGPTFQGILSASNKGVVGDDGYLVWNDNWVTFLDTMLQIQILSDAGLQLPTRIRSIRIDPATHVDRIIQADSDHTGWDHAGYQLPSQLPARAQVDHVLNACVAGGVQIVGLHTTVAPRHQQHTAPVLEMFQFVPYNEDNMLSDEDDLVKYLRLCKAYIRRGLVQLLDSGFTENLPNVGVLKQQLAKMKVDDVLDIDSSIETLASDPKCVLATTLQQIFSPEKNDLFVENIRDMLVSLRGKLTEDKLLGSAMTDRMLKTCLDVVLENCGSTKLKVVEYVAADSRVYQSAVAQLETQPLMKLDYTAVDFNIKNFDTDHLDSFGVKLVEWKLGGSPPGHLGNADVTIACNVLHKEADLVMAISSLMALVKDGGFLLVQEPTTNFIFPLMLDALTNELSISDADRRTCGQLCDAPTWMNLLKSAGLEVIAQKSDGLINTLFLCRKCTTNASTQQQTSIDLSSTNFDWVEEVKTALVSVDDRPVGHNVWLKADRSCNGIIGMVNCLRLEPRGDKVRCIFNGSLDQSQSMPAVEGSLFESLVHKDQVMNIYRDGKWGSFRHIPLQKEGRHVTKRMEHAYVNVLTLGDLSSLKWIESPLKYFVPADHQNKELCSVYYASLNFRDIMLATGKLPPDAIPGEIATKDSVLGMEFSGRNPAGNRIMGLVAGKGLASSVDADRRFIWPVPDHWTLEQAASVPVVYSTVYYALVVRGHIKKIDRVLIHSGSGCVGQAAISVALHRGCEVFTTVGSKEKRECLKQKFPQLEDSHFANSRDLSFELDIKRATNGKGVNVVLNSLAEEKLQASLRLLAQHGQFLEIGKFDLSNDSQLGMAIFLRNVTIHGVLLDTLFEEDNSDWGTVAALLSEGIADGAVLPLNTTVFDKGDIEEAFRYMAQGKHIGKVVIKVRVPVCMQLKCSQNKLVDVAR
ncbi:Fatty acid synthase [Lamellibrachia satsuma]|nr:Fatty acid synthase [Lamellibrachia satsuma]